MPRDLAADVDLYAEMVNNLALYRDREEVINLFVMREVIEERRSTTRLAGEVLQQLERADAALAGQAGLLRRRFRALFRFHRASDIPRRFWWWYLDEGPQVREHAKGVA